MIIKCSHFVDPDICPLSLSCAGDQSGDYLRICKEKRMFKVTLMKHVRVTIIFHGLEKSCSCKWQNRIYNLMKCFKIGLLDNSMACLPSSQLLNFLLFQT